MDDCACSYMVVDDRAEGCRILLSYNLHEPYSAGDPTHPPSQIPRSLMRVDGQHDTSMLGTEYLYRIIIYEFTFASGLCLDRDSSTRTTLFGPPRVIGMLTSVVERTSLNQDGD